MPRLTCSLCTVAASFVLLCLAFAKSALAADSRFEIRSAYVEPVEGIYLLTAQMHFDLPEGARQAVRDGVVFTFDVDIALHRYRRLWFDASVATLAQHYQVSYHALSDRFVVRNMNSGEQTSYATLDSALESLMQIRGLPVLDASLIDRNEDYEFSLRATLDVRTLPEALRWVLFWKDDWKQRTVWYVWSLPR
ncbi:MAG TPA: DUF4390 domain-containing protein [Steroidobacteraceae bacterium]|nr:DUF4390 domain-containing protein [Steroidobacteraceae bacterium]